MLLLAVAGVSNIAFAGDDLDLGGMYVGGSPKVTQTLVKYSFKNEGLVGGFGYQAPSFLQSFKSDAGKSSGALEAFVGYGRVLRDNIYVAGEVYAGRNTAHVTPYDDSHSGDATGLFKVKVKRNTYGGLAALLGYRAAPRMLAYLRLGAEVGEWRADVIPNSATVMAAQNTASESAKTASNKTFTKSTNGFNLVPGFGLQSRITKSTSVRVECSFPMGVSILGLSQDITGYPNLILNGTSVTHDFRITQARLGVSFCYHG